MFRFTSSKIVKRACHNRTFAKSCSEKASQIKPTTNTPNEKLCGAVKKPCNGDNQLQQPAWTLCEKPKEKVIKTCMDEPAPAEAARRPRKTPTSKASCSKPAPNKQAACNTGLPEKVCRTINMTGCGTAKKPPKCEKHRETVICERIVPPTPSFHECVKELLYKKFPDECQCFKTSGECSVLK